MEVSFYDKIDYKLLEDNQDTLYIIDDNLLNSVHTSIVSGNDYKNILPIKTRKNNSNKKSCFFKDSEYDTFVESIFRDFIKIKSLFYRFDKISLSKSGYGRYMETYSPNLRKHLYDLLKHNFGFDNKELTISKRIPSYNEIRDAKNLNISGYQEIKNELIKNNKSIGITTDEEFIIGDIIKLKRDDTDEQLIVKVNINSYHMDFVDIIDYNLFEGYTKSNKGSYQFQFEYVGVVKGGTIEFADNRLNKIDDNIKHINRNNTIEVKPVEVIENDTEDQELLDLSKVDDIIAKEFIEEFMGESVEVIGRKPKPNIMKSLSVLVDTEITSILELSNMEYLILDTKYLYRINDYGIINKIDMIDFDVVETLGKVFLYIKERVLGQDRVISMEMNYVTKSELLNFLNGR